MYSFSTSKNIFKRTFYCSLIMLAGHTYARFQPTNVDDLYSAMLQESISNMEEPEKIDSSIAKVFEDIFNHANILLKENNIDEAISLYKHAINLNPSSAQAHYNLGIALESKNQHAQAIEKFEKAISIDPKYTKAHMQLAKTFQEQRQLENAIEHYNKALSIEPSLLDARLGIARVFCEQYKFDQAIIHLNEVLKTKPTELQLVFELANAYNMANQIEQSLELYYQLLKKNPNNPSILYNIAYTLKKAGKITEAMPFYKAVLENSPNHSEAHFSLGLAYMLNGDFEKGWEQYEWRWKRSEQSGSKRNFEQPEWDGSDLSNKTIYLYAEQGLGDTFQFIRYARLAKEKGGTVIVSVQNPLVSFLSQCPYIDKVITLREQPRTFDVWAPLMSLPYILKTRIDTVPDEVPYLFANPTLEKEWAEKLKKDRNFKIGITWQGNSNYSTPFLRAVVAAKSIALEKFAPISRIPGVSLYSLQKETGVEQLQNLPSDFKLITFDGDFDNTNGRFMDTAAVMKNMDLVITIDTSIGHISAGLGVPTWVLIPNPPDWRWMLDRSDTPWYPNMRLFRQPVPDNWDPVIEAITNALVDKLSNKESILKTDTVTQNHASTGTNRPAQYELIQIDALSQELTMITNRLVKLGAKIQNHKNASPLDENFNKDVRTFYLLSEIRTTIQNKIEVLTN